jgi:hypothetical protein
MTDYDPVPDRVAGPSKQEAWRDGVDFLMSVYKEYGWSWS